MMKRKLPKPGDRVMVPFGGDDVEGEVIYVNAFFDPPEAHVEFKVHEDDDFTTRNMYTLDEIRPVPARAKAA
jgi:hypothetical protein